MAQIASILRKLSTHRVQRMRPCGGMRLSFEVAELEHVYKFDFGNEQVGSNGFGRYSGMT